MSPAAEGNEKTGARIEPGWSPAPFLRVSAAAHIAGGAAFLYAPERWPVIAGALVLDHTAIVLAGILPRSPFLGSNMTRLPPGRAASGDVALTLDDGPDPVVTPRVLDLLDRHGARATFFCIGEKVNRHPDLAREIASRGHAIENHSHSHLNGFFFCLPARLGAEIDRAQDAISSATGRVPRLFRAPAGVRSPLLDRALSQRGLGLVSWTRRGYDTVATDPARIVARLTNGLAAGDILLLHDTPGGRMRGRRSVSADGRGAVVLEALPRVLDAITARSLRATPILWPVRETEGSS